MERGPDLLIRKRQTFFGYIMRRQALENLFRQLVEAGTERNYIGKVNWMHVEISPIELIRFCRDRVTYTYVIWQVNQN